jgi:hypothetical protein
MDSLANYDFPKTKSTKDPVPAKVKTAKANLSKAVKTAHDKYAADCSAAYEAYFEAIKE